MINYPRVELYLAERLPELSPLLETYWRRQGAPGEHPGPYILFEDAVRPYITHLLASEPSSTRDRLLRRVFAVVESMLSEGDEEVQGLASIALLEGQSTRWFASAVPFFGPLTQAEANRYDSHPRQKGPVLNAGGDLYSAGALVSQLLSAHSSK